MNSIKYFHHENHSGYKILSRDEIDRLFKPGLVLKRKKDIAQWDKLSS